MICIERMTAAQRMSYITIAYSFLKSLFGELLIASTEVGICYLVFVEEQENALLDLKKLFPNAIFQEKNGILLHERALLFFSEQKDEELTLHLPATDFQLKVWQYLIQIPFGETVTYSDVAKAIGKPNASRAAGTAIGGNLVAFIIPCHRVIQKSGALGGYRWGVDRKKQMLINENSPKY